MNLFVYIVSDAAESSASIAMWLSINGHRTAICSSVDDLLGSHQPKELCAVVVDFKEGGAVERDLAKRMYECSPATPLYFIASGLFTRGALLSAPPNVTKIFDSPYSPEELAEAIRETCTCENIGQLN